MFYGIVQYATIYIVSTTETTPLRQGYGIVQVLYHYPPHLTTHLNPTHTQDRDDHDARRSEKMHQPSKLEKSKTTRKDHRHMFIYNCIAPPSNNKQGARKKVKDPRLVQDPDWVGMVLRHGHGPPPVYLKQDHTRDDAQHNLSGRYNICRIRNTSSR